MTIKDFRYDLSMDKNQTGRSVLEHRDIYIYLYDDIRDRYTYKTLKRATGIHEEFHRYLRVWSKTNESIRSTGEHD